MLCQARDALLESRQLCTHEPTPAISVVFMLHLLFCFLHICLLRVSVSVFFFFLSQSHSDTIRTKFNFEICSIFV